MTFCVLCACFFVVVLIVFVLICFALGTAHGYIGYQIDSGQSQLDTDDLDEEERKALAEVSKTLGQHRSDR